MATKKAKEKFITAVAPIITENKTSAPHFFIEWPLCVTSSGKEEDGLKKKKDHRLVV